MKESWEELYANRAARTNWPAEQSERYQEQKNGQWAPDFTDVGKGRNVGIWGVFIFVSVFIVLAVLAKLNVI